MPPARISSSAACCKMCIRDSRTEDVDRFLDKVEEQLRDDDAQAEQLRKQIADLTAENQKLHDLSLIHI